MMCGRIGPSWARATVDGWRSRAWRRARCSDTRAVPPPARAGSSTPSPSWCARATVENDANWHKLASIPSLPSELQERIFTSRRVTANTERGEASVASSRQRATERDSRAFGSPRASAEAVVAKAGVGARQRRPPSTALTGALQPARFSWNRERAREVGAMSTPARKRLMRDFKRLQKDPPAGISGTPTEANIMVRAHTRLHRVGLTRQICPSAPPLQTRRVSTPSRAALPHLPPPDVSSPPVPPT
jgi:hypothetical protein